ncbi:hypothetical protein BGX26_009227 [Mortierella sp. AD094]|nr:hypothetical protein BGX26_009227 [Mortierella sp. AD094]
MARLKAVFSPNHHHRTQPRPTTAAPRRTGRKKVVTRQPVRKTGFFHRTPRRTVVATQRRPGFLGSLRPRHTRTARPAGRSHPHHGHHKHDKHHHHSHKGSTLAALLAVFALKKNHDHKKHHNHRH